MNPVKRFFVASIFVVSLTALMGCASAPERTTTPEVIAPKAPPGIANVEAAKQDLAALLKAVKFIIVCDHANCASVAEDSYEDANPNVTIFKYVAPRQLQFAVEKVEVLCDRIEFPFAPLLYEDLRGFTIAIHKDMHGRFLLELPNEMVVENVWRTGEPEKEYITNLRRFADDLFFIQQDLEKYTNERLALFESQAAHYRKLSVKPSVSEEQRRFIVGANALAQEKKYGKAICMYQKALEQDPVFYPRAYYNMAMLYAQERLFDRAISSMKQYLLLEPDAQDARSSQDKIYEWEAMLQK